MGYQLEIAKMFAYIMIPIGFFHMYSHTDPEVFRLRKEEHVKTSYGNAIKKAEAYVQHRIETELNTPDFNPKDVFWTHGKGYQYLQKKSEELSK